jgi:hypothetical protein
MLPGSATGNRQPFKMHAEEQDQQDAEPKLGIDWPANARTVAI